MTASTTAAGTGRGHSPRNSARRDRQRQTRAARGTTAIRRATRWSLRAIALAVLLILLLIAILSALFRLGSPHIGVYKSEIQAWLSDYLKTPVEIGEMDFSWGGANPRITLENVTLQGNGGGVADGISGSAGAAATGAVNFRQVWLDLNLPATVFARGWDINEVTIVGADLDLEYYGKQDFRVRGYDQAKADAPSRAETVDGEKPDKQRGSRALGWLLAARKAALIDSSLTVHDMQNQREYRLDSINIHATNQANKHRLEAEVVLPDGFGKSLQLDASLESQDGDLQQASGRASLKGEQLVFERWMDLIPKRSLDLAGTANIDINGEWNATKLNLVTALIDSPQITFGAYPKDDTAMELSKFSSRIEWQRTVKGWLANVAALDFVHQDTASAFEQTSLEIVDKDNGRSWRLDSGGAQVELGLLAQLSETFRTLLPMGQWPDVMAQANPVGELRDWRLSVDRGVRSTDAGGLPAVSVSGLLNDLQTTAFDSMPGISGIDMQLAIRDNAGQIDLRGNQVVFEQAQSFTTPLQLEKLDGVLDIAVTRDEIEVSSKAVVLRDRSLTGDLDFTFKHSKKNPAWLHLNGRYDLAQISELTRYLPRGRIKPWIADWLKKSVQAGQASNGQVLFKGPFSGFPFHRVDGEFEAGMDLRNARLDYRDTWPAVENASGRLTFSKKSLGFDLQSGSINGIELLPGKAQIDSLFRPVVNLQMQANDSVENYLSFIQSSPIRATLGPALADVKALGDAKLAVALNVPLRARRVRQADEVFNVRGTLGFENNQLSSNQYRTTLDKVNGDLVFTHRGFGNSSVDAQYLGAPVAIEMRSSGQGAERVSEMDFSGLVDNQTLVRHHNLPLDNLLSGQSAWYVSVEIPHDSAIMKRRGVLLSATSNLRGVTLDLPKPLGKAAASAKRLRVSTRFAADAKSPVWRVQLGKQGSALIASDADGGLRSLAINLGGSTANSSLPQGIHVSGRTEEFSLDDWVATIAAILDTPDDASAATDWPLISANLQTPNLLIGEKGHGAARIKVTSNGSFLNGVIENSLLRGSVRMPRTVGTQGDPIQVRIANADKRLLDGYLEIEGAAETVEPPVDPLIFPPMNIHLAKLQWDELLFEDVVARTQPDAAGMKITTLGFVHDNAQMSGDGFWQWRDPQNINPATRNQQLSQIDLQIRSNDVGRALDKFGFDATIAEGKGSVDASFYWDGPIYKPRLEDLDGNVQMALRRGRLLDVEPGAARIIGLFAFESLPRRLALDFTDITAEGMDFDSIDGRLKISDGIAKSELVQLQGPVGVVDVTGSANLVNRTYNQKVTVLPRISAALPILGAISGGATAGIGVLIAGPLLKALGVDFDKIGLTEYSVTGNWSEPRITPIRSAAPSSSSRSGQ